MTSFHPPRDANGQIIVESAIDPASRQPLSAFLPSAAPVSDERPTRPRSSWPALAAGTATLLLIIAFVAWPRQPAGAGPAPTATAVPTIAPSVTVPALGRAVVAYTAPDGTAIGAIEPGRS